MEQNKRKERIKELRAQVQKLEAEEEAYSKLPLNESLAIALHERFCHINHVDGCGWQYEIKHGKHDWEKGWAHKRYLVQANDIINLFGDRLSQDEILKIGELTR